ncbi:uncharacterized protein LOC131928374 [Physella acuta]|uniref:uncharacterized protein LOC131928374 n=1 Tax=Physella acuta TaxID=109671 RepID=UPI0027DBECBD|nr:uncharacterized protein LOC131928374 [Physella acuta]
MFDVCVMIPNPVIDIPLMVAYKNTWLYKGQCVSRLCVTWTNVRFDLYRFNVKITISNVSERDYGEMEFKFGTSYIHENLSVNYFPVLVQRGTKNSKDRNDTDDSMKYMIAFIILVLFCIIGCGLLSFKKVRKSIQQLR